MKKLCMLFLLGALQGIHGQSDKKPAAADSLVYYHEQVTITATRYKEDISKVPYAVSVIDAAQLSALKGNGLDEALNSVPGVLAQSRAGGQDVRIVIRGFGARGAGDRSNSGTTRGIRIMTDGIPETEPDGRTSFDLIDPSLSGSIEVVRSNVSALWGNAAGGVINISSFPYDFVPYSEARYYSGSFGFQKLNLRSLVNTGNMKIAAGFSTSISDGWRRHSASKHSVLNVSLLSQVSGSSSLGVILTGASSIFHIPGPLNIDQFNSDARMANPDYEKRDERRYNRLGRIGVSFDHQLSQVFSLSSMAFVNPKYLQRSERGTYRDFTRYHTGGNVMLTGNFSVAGMNNKAILGVDEAYQDGAILFYKLSKDNNRSDSLRTNKREGANNLGVFLHDEISITPAISLMAGLRYDNITYYSDEYLAEGPGLQKKSFEKISPKAGIIWKTGAGSSVYANFAMGVEAPAGNETDPAPTFGQDTVYLINPLLDVIRSTTYEAGYRYMYIPRASANSLLRSVGVNVALYHINTQNDIIPYKGGRFFFTAGKTTRTGIELGTDILMSGGIALQASVTYSSNEYSDYKVDSVHYNLKKAGHYAAYDDNKIAGIPEYFYNAVLSYSPVFLPQLYLGIGMNGMSEYYADDANSIEVPSYIIMNASVGLTQDIHLWKNLGIKGMFSVSNITDKKYAASAFINPDVVNGKPVYLEAGLPRNYTLSVSLSL